MFAWQTFLITLLFSDQELIQASAKLREDEFLTPTLPVGRLTGHSPLDDDGSRHRARI
jgi:hypothetical protein